MSNGVFILLLVLGSASANHPEYVEPEKIVVQCIEPKGNGNINQNNEATSRRSEDRKILVQWQKCYEV